MPGGAMPVIEFEDGQMINQSLAIANFVAKNGGLFPKDPILALECESLTHDFADYMGAFTGPVVQPDQSK